jgi:ribosome maturation factor RimP
MKIKKFGGTEQKVYDLAKPIADQLGLDIWDVRFEKEGACWYLRIFIDREEGVSIDDCEAMTRPVSKLLDEHDPIPQGYILEVGSAGIERELIRESHFEASVGAVIRVRMIRELEGRKEMIVLLNSWDKEALHVSLSDEEGGGEMDIPLADTAFVKLYEDFEELA